MTTISDQHHRHHIPLAAAGAAAAIVLGLGVVGVVIAESGDNAVPQQTPAQQHQGGTTANQEHRGRYLAQHQDHFQYLGSGGRVQQGQ